MYTLKGYMYTFSSKARKFLAGPGRPDVVLFTGLDVGGREVESLTLAVVISTDYLAILGQRVWGKQGSLRASWNRYSKDKTEENRRTVLDSSSEAMDYREDFLDLVRKELGIK